MATQTFKDKVRTFLKTPGSITRMIAATKKGRPALEAVIPGLMKAVPGNYNNGKIHRRIGKIAKDIMDKNGGYVVIRDNKSRRPIRCKLNSNCSPFIEAARYQ